MLQAALSVALTYVPHNHFNRIISLAFSLREASPLFFSFLRCRQSNVCTPSLLSKGQSSYFTVNLSLKPGSKHMDCMQKAFMCSLGVLIVDYLFAAKIVSLRSFVITCMFLRIQKLC